MGFLLRRGPLIAFAFVLIAIPAFSVEAKTLAAWLVLPAMMTVVVMFVVMGFHCATASLLTLLSKQPPVSRAIGAVFSLAFGVFFMWAGGAGLYAFLSQVPLRGS